MNRNLRERGAIRQEVVDTNGLLSLENIRSRNNILLMFDPKKFLVQRIEQIFTDYILEDRVALVFDFMERLGEHILTESDVLHTPERIVPIATRIVPTGGIFFTRATSSLRLRRPTTTPEHEQ